MGKSPDQGRCDGRKGQCVKVMSVVCENEGEAPDQVRCDVKEGQCVKVMGIA